MTSESHLRSRLLALPLRRPVYLDDNNIDFVEVDAFKGLHTSFGSLVRTVLTMLHLREEGKAGYMHLKNVKRPSVTRTKRKALQNRKVLKKRIKVYIA